MSVIDKKKVMANDPSLCHDLYPEAGPTCVPPSRRFVQKLSACRCGWLEPIFRPCRKSLSQHVLLHFPSGLLARPEVTCWPSLSLHLAQLNGRLRFDRSHGPERRSVRTLSHRIPWTEHPRGKRIKRSGRKRHPCAERI
jgi:hypothetical protein